MFALKLKVTEPIETIILDQDDTTLSIQQTLLLQQQLRRLDAIDRANEHLDQKAATIFQASTLIVTLVGVFNIPAFLDSSEPQLNYVTAIAFIAFLVMVGLSLVAWSPKKTPLPGPERFHSDAENIDDWNRMLSRYIYVDEGISFDQAMVNYIDVTERLRATNTSKARFVRGSAAALIVQVLCLAYIACIV